MHQVLAHRVEQFPTGIRDNSLSVNTLKQQLKRIFLNNDKRKLVPFT